MLDLQTRTRPPSVLPEDQVRRFLIESERRVIVHCQKLLSAPNLTTDQRRRLTRLLGEAEARLDRFAS